LSIKQDGNSTKKTTFLTLSFDKDIDLAKKDITISGIESTGATIGDLTKVSGKEYTLPVQGIKTSGTINVTVSKTGYKISGNSEVNVFYADILVTFNDIQQYGNEWNTTGSLYLYFSSPGISGLAASDITLSNGITIKSLSDLSGDGTRYELVPNGISAETKSVTVWVEKSGYKISGNGKTVPVYYMIPVGLYVTANGTTNTETTTELTLNFSSPGIANLADGDITIDAGNTGAVKGSLSGSNTSYTLTLSGIKMSGYITVSVSKSGYSVNKNGVNVYYSPVYPIGGKSLKAEFGITTTGTTGVRDTFNAVSNFIKNNSLNNQTKIELGDYIDLEGGLTVAAHGGSSFSGGPISISSGTGVGEASWRITTLSKPYNPYYDSVYLRLIVVGINSFNGKNGNSKNHIVFQFQNIPVVWRMNWTDTNYGGYASSDMRSYLTDNFLPGLTSAGVPEGVLWAPKRLMASSYSSSGSGTTQIEDKLWLPTEREMFGMSRYSNNSAETEANQGRLDYYYNGGTGSFARRVKYSSGDLNSSGVPTSSYGDGTRYWEASPSSAGSSFCIVSDYGHPDDRNSSSITFLGVAPAFCVAAY
jgi:hypothetical protein